MYKTVMTIALASSVIFGAINSQKNDNNQNDYDMPHIEQNNSFYEDEKSDLNYENFYLDELDFGVLHGIKWEDNIFAPFVDMGAWVTDAKYSNNGALNLAQVMEDTGIKYYNIGFINAVDETINENGVLNWGFGAYEVLSEEHSETNMQFQGIKKAIYDVRQKGGDITISIGGLNERNFYQYTDDIDVLVNTYIEIIDGFNLTRIDLDIEGSAQGYDTNKTNAKAMKIVQEKTGVEVVLTLPVLPTGLTENFGVGTLQAYLDENVDIKAVNIMAMCYGESFGDYAQGSIQAIDSTMLQIKEAYKKIGINLSDLEAYNKVGVTTSIGYEGFSHPVFTTENSNLVVNHAKDKNINFVSFWSLNRDGMTQENQGINAKYEHTQIYKSFEDDTIFLVPQENILTNQQIEYSKWSRENEAVGMYVPNFIVEHNNDIYKQISEYTTWWCEPGTDDLIWQKIN